MTSTVILTTVTRQTSKVYIEHMIFKKKTQILTVLVHKRISTYSELLVISHPGIGILIQSAIIFHFYEVTTKKQIFLSHIFAQLLLVALPMILPQADAIKVEVVEFFVFQCRYQYFQPSVIYLIDSHTSEWHCFYFH
jgi:hypothetical protein